MGPFEWGPDTVLTCEVYISIQGRRVWMRSSLLPCPFSNSTSRFSSSHEQLSARLLLILTIRLSLTFEASHPAIPALILQGAPQLSSTHRPSSHGISCPERFRHAPSFISQCQPGNELHCRTNAPTRTNKRLEHTDGANPRHKATTRYIDYMQYISYLTTNIRV